MRSTKQLSKALILIQAEAIEKIKSFFKDKHYVRIHVMPSQHLNIDTGKSIGTVTEIRSNGDVVATVGRQSVLFSESFNCGLPADALLTILDELERMKKTGQLRKV